MMAKLIEAARLPLLGGVLLALGACATQPAVQPVADKAVPTEVRIVAFNDFHGNLMPPGLAIEAPLAGGGSVQVPAGGAPWLASAIRAAKSEGPNTIVVSAGDMIGASPLASALFLDEPTIEVMNAAGVDFNAAGNHEFDKGSAELKRLANGGCAKNTLRVPCQLNKDFPGASFGILTANTIDKDGSTLFPAVGIKTVGSGASAVKIAFIGLTLQGTSQLVSPNGISGIHFAPEAETVNALVPGLKAQGINAIVVLIHEGGYPTSKPMEDCAGLQGPIVSIVEALDPAVDLVVSGHTHRAYVCEMPVQGRSPVLLTSAGKYGTMLTDIRLQVDPVSGDVVARSAKQQIIQSVGFENSTGRIDTTDAYPQFQPDQQVAGIVAAYGAAAAPLALRPIGSMTASAPRTQVASGESVFGNLIADAQLEATRAPEQGGADIALINEGGVRTDLIPDTEGKVRFSQLFNAQPFGNQMIVRSYTGAELKAILEQQFRGNSGEVMSVSDTLRYSFDMRRPEGDRVRDIRVKGRALDMAATYRVTINDFLSAGGDGFTAFKVGRDTQVGAGDVDVMEAYFAAHSPVTPPATNRIKRLDDGKF